MFLIGEKYTCLNHDLLCSFISVFVSLDLIVPHFQHLSLHRKKSKTSKRNSGGIVIYIRDYLVTDKSLFCESEDDILWLRLDGKLFSLENDLFVGLSYIMSERSGRFNLIEHNVFDILSEYIACKHNHTNGQYNILLSGDFNSRTSVNRDYIDFDTSGEFLSLPDDYTADRVRPRVSQDNGHTNNNGIALLEFCKQTGLRILNGWCGPDDVVGKYTFVGSRGCSLVDYVLASEPILDCITSFKCKLQI